VCIILIHLCVVKTSGIILTDKNINLNGAEIFDILYLLVSVDGSLYIIELCLSLSMYLTFYGGFLIYSCLSDWKS